MKSTSKNQKIRASRSQTLMLSSQALKNMDNKNNEPKKNINYSKI